MRIITILAGLLFLFIPVLADLASPNPIDISIGVKPNILGDTKLMPEFKVMKTIDLSNIPEATLQLWGLAWDYKTDTLWMTNFGGSSNGKLYRIKKEPGGDGKAVIVEGPITLTGNIPPYALGLSVGKYQSDDYGLWLGGANQSYQWIADPSNGNVKWIDYIDIWSNNSQAGNGTAFNRKLDILYMCDTKTVQNPYGMDEIAWTIKPDKDTKWEKIKQKKICGLECDKNNDTDTPKQLFALEREWENTNEDSEIFGFWLVDGKPIFPSWSVKVPGTKTTQDMSKNLTADLTFDGRYFYIMVQEYVTDQNPNGVDTILICGFTNPDENIESASIGEIKATYK
ncbi:MAG: hypothetical protein ACUVWP_02525 [bacterium]